MYDNNTLTSALTGYCKWQTLPRQLLLSGLSGWAERSGSDTVCSDAPDDILLDAFLQALGSAVPVEWSVSQHAASTGANSRQQDQIKQQQDGKQQQATMYGQAVGTPYGIMCFGGLELGKLTEIKVKSEVSWIKEHNGYMLQPDFSRVYQSSSSQHSRQVFTVTPDSKHGSWSARPASPALPMGLLGHSVVLYGSRVFVFGGLEMGTPVVIDPKAPGPKAPTQTVNKLRAYAVDEAGTQGGMLPVLSDVPQMGPQPCSRMYHRAAVDPDAGVMYVYGGVHIRNLDGSRWPADKEPGTLHCYNFHSYTWSILATTGSCRPRSTTLLAFCWHQGALWAIPDLTLGSGSSSSRSQQQQLKPSGYKLLRLDVITRAWQEIATQGEAPCWRSDCCSLYHNGQIIIYGGKTASSPIRMLSDLLILDLNQLVPTWKQVQPRLTASTVVSKVNSNSTGRTAMLALAGHCGGVDASGQCIFWGGYRRIDLKEPQSLIQVLQQGVKPPTPDAAQLTGVAASPLTMALQHVRQQLARLVRQHYPRQVLLRPDGGGGVRLPARLLALYSSLFDEMFQEMLEEDEEDEAAAAGGQPKEVPVPGASLEGVAGVSRWMMGLLALGSCPMNMLVEMYRVADRLIMERLMVEVLEVLGAADMTPQQAAAVLQLTGDMSGRGDVVGLEAHAAQQLTQQVTPITAPGIMALALQMNNKQLQDCCCEVMMAHKKNDVWAVLEFMCRFSLPRLQGSCLHFLSQLSRGRLVDHAERIVKVATRYGGPGRALSSLPVVQMLEKDLCLELSLLEGNITALTSYAAAAERLQLQKVRQGLIECCSSASCWKQLQEQKQVWRHLQQRFPDLARAISQKASLAQ